MSRFRLSAMPALCLALAALSGCGGEEVAAPKTAKAAVIATGTAPIAESATIVTVEDQSAKAKLHATDADGDALTFSITEAPIHGEVTLDAATGAFDLQPQANYFGTDSFGYSVSDGRGNIAHARVEVIVQPSSDPPAIDASATEVVAAGQDAHLRVELADPDGNPVTLSVSQVSGAEQLSNLQATVQEVIFHAPDVSTATDVELLLEARDSTGLTARKLQVVTLSPVSASGKLFTVIGTLDSAELHWVITGDGFAADQQQDLLRASLDMARRLTGAAELARHAGVLNVHVLTAVSRDSGVTTQGASRALRTAYDGTLGCTDVERVACVNWDKVHAAVLSEHAPFDVIAVVLNTTLYVGNTSGPGLIVSRNTYAPAITLHEMGHVVAGLGDEYVDQNVGAALVPRYREGQFPNVTTETDPSRIPWRHWFADPVRIPVTPGEPGVGRFEGAFYTANGFYRPKQDSIMRTLEGAIGEVNAEAWLRALYRAVPPIRAAYPEQRIVSGLAGNVVEFEIVSAWPPQVMSVHWFVDGSEIELARGSYSYALHADGARHDVRAEIEDCTGGIRMPGAHEQSGTVSWTVSNEPGAVTSKALSSPVRMGGWIRMRIDSSGHHVQGMTSDEPRRLPLPGEAVVSGFEYALFDAQGVILAAGNVADPRVVRAPLPSPGSPGAGHVIRTLPEGYYLIGIPEGGDARKLRIRKRNESVEKASSEQWLDL